MVCLPTTVLDQCPSNDYNTIRTCDDLKKEGFEKHCGKRRKCWQPAFSPFPTLFSTLSKKEYVILATFNLSSANAFKLVTSKILSFGKGLTLSHTFLSLSNSKEENIM